jgi:hypothetical protein
LSIKEIIQKTQLKKDIVQDVLDSLVAIGLVKPATRRFKYSSEQTFVYGKSNLKITVTVFVHYSSRNAASCTFD